MMRMIEMMRNMKLRNSLGLILTLSIALTFSVSADMKIAVIDMKKVFDEYWKTKRVSADFEERKKEFAGQHQGMIEKYQTMNEEYRKTKESVKDPSISENERERRNDKAEEQLKEIQGLERDIQNHQKSMESNLSETRFRLRRNILQDIRKLINTKAETGGYALVLDTAAQSLNQTDVVLYSKGADDITEDILNTLNADASANEN